MIVVGSIPSRRFGKCLGINKIPPKICSYSGIYFQAGESSRMSKSREGFYAPEEIFKKLQIKIADNL